MNIENLIDNIKYLLDQLSDHLSNAYDEHKLIVSKEVGNSVLNDSNTMTDDKSDDHNKDISYRESLLNLIIAVNGQMETNNTWNQPEKYGYSILFDKNGNIIKEELARVGMGITNYINDGNTLTINDTFKPDILNLAYGASKWLPVSSDGYNRYGNKYYEDGFRYRGRGLMQLTGRRNYELLSNLINVDLVSDPDILIKDRVIHDKAVTAWFNHMIDTYKLDKLNNVLDAVVKARLINAGSRNKNANLDVARSIAKNIISKDSQFAIFGGDSYVL